MPERSKFDLNNTGFLLEESLKEFTRERTNPFDSEYHKLLSKILYEGVKKEDRTRTGTLSIFGYQMRFDLEKGFPLLTTKRVHMKSIIHELLWFLSGNTNIKKLNENKVRIWNEWADENGNLGPIYGDQWRSWTTGGGKRIDQISEVIDQIKKTPYSRRLIVSSWNVGELEKMALSPCHALFQFYIVNGKLSCQLYQRSADIFLGVPFNIASYALLTLMTAQVTGHQAGEFIHTFGDAHLYLNHLDQAYLQLSRGSFPPPRMKFNTQVKDIFDFKYEDFTLINYQSHPPIKADISI